MAMLALAVMAVVIVGLTLIYVQPGELRVPVRYSQFDPKHFTLGQWYYLLTYVLFAAIVFGAHMLLSAKLYQLRGRQAALAFVYLGVGVLIITAVFFLAIVKVVSLTQ